MRLHAKYPMLIRGRPRGLRGERYVRTHVVDEVDVPELSSAETSVALEPVQEFSTGFPFVGQESETLLMRSLPELREYRGRLYRSLAGAPSFDCAFPQSGRNSRAYMSSTVPHVYMDRSPLSFPIRSRMNWLYEVLALDLARNYSLWPKERSDAPVETGTGFPDALIGIDDVNHEDIALAFEMIAAQSSRLIAVDGTLWMETKPPCIEVSASMADYIARLSRLKMDIGFLRDMPDFELGRCSFPLTRLGEMQTFAQAIREGYGEGQSIVTYGVGDTSCPLLDFDPDAEDIYRTAHTLATGIVRRVVQHGYHAAHRDSDPLFEGDDEVVFAAVRDELFATNDILGRRGNLAEMLPVIERLWRKVKRPLYGASANSNAQWLVDDFVRRHVEKVESRAIDINGLGFFS
jgi:hypothetical protein